MIFSQKCKSRGWLVGTAEARVSLVFERALRCPNPCAGHDGGRLPVRACNRASQAPPPSMRGDALSREKLSMQWRKCTVVVNKCILAVDYCRSFTLLKKL
jgi:hypothetical protein